MLKFILGVVVGGVVGFLICAVLSINNSEKDRDIPTLESCETGDSDAPRN